MRKEMGVFPSRVASSDWMGEDMPTLSDWVISVAAVRSLSLIWPCLSNLYTSVPNGIARSFPLA